MHSPMRPHFNWHSSNDEFQQPPQATSQCMARSKPMWQPLTRWGMRQIMKRSNIPRDLWKYYIDAPKLWDHNDYDETGVHNGIRSILMMNSFQNVVPWWMQNASLDGLVRLKLKFTSIIRAKEEIDRFANEVMHNNNLDKDFLEDNALELYRNLQAACTQLFTEVNTPIHHESFDEIFRLYINYFVTTTENDGEKLYNYIMDSADGDTTPAFPQLHSFTPDKVRSDAAVDVEPIVTHIKGAAEKLEASAPMARRNSPDMILVPQDSAEAIIKSATTLSFQPVTVIDEVYENEEDKEDDENDDTDTKEEGVEAEGEGVRSDTIYMQEEVLPGKENTEVGVIDEGMTIPKIRIIDGSSSLRAESLQGKEVKETEVGSKTEPKLSINDEFSSL